jgi:hypothetical protein
MELAAVVASPKWIRESRPTTTRVQIFSDSRYVIDNIPRAPYWCAVSGLRLGYYAYAWPMLAAELHRHHVCRVQMNNQPKYPQILRIVEEIASPKRPVVSKGQSAVAATEPRDSRAAV